MMMISMANIFLSFAFRVLPEQKRDTNMEDTYFAITNNFLNIEANILFPIFLIEVNERAQ